MRKHPTFGRSTRISLIPLVLSLLSLGVPAVAAAEWSRWESLGGRLIGSPAVGRNDDGRLEVFARDTGAFLWHRWQTAPNSDWNEWHRIGGQALGHLAVAQNADGRLQVFARDLGNNLRYIMQRRDSRTGWGGWHLLGRNCTGSPAVERGADGRLEAFWTEGASLWRSSQREPNDEFRWNDETRVHGAVRGDPALGRNADGRLQLFVRGATDVLWTMTKPSPGGNWLYWAPLGGVLRGSPAVAQNADGRLEVFVQGTDGGLWHRWQLAPNAGWSAWQPLGGSGVPTIRRHTFGRPVVARTADGRLAVFVLDAVGGLYHIAQRAPNSGWSAWQSLGGGYPGANPNNHPAVGQNQDGRLEVFVVGADGALWHRWQTRD